MADRIPVPNPERGEELRQLAAAVADMHHVVGTVIENAKELLPGEAVDGMKEAWAKSQTSMKTVVETLLQADPSGDFFQMLVQNELTGEVGKTKKDVLARFKDRFFMFLNSEPRTSEKRAKSAEALGDYLELGFSVVGSIPGYEQVVELVSLIKQLVGVRAKREV